MRGKTKGRDGGDRATPNTSHTCNSTLIRTRIKAGIVRLALWGLLPIPVADWIIQHGGLRDA